MIPVCGGLGIGNAATVEFRCRNCGQPNLTPLTPYWSRCPKCGEVTYTPRESETKPSNASLSESSAKRLRYGVETVPVPVRIDPRIRFMGLVFGFVAASLYVASAPVAIFLIGASRGLTLSEVMLVPGASVIATLWIFQCIGFAATGFYCSVIVMWKKAHVGGGWAVLGFFELIFSLVFVFPVGLTGAWLGVAAGILLIVGGVLNSL